MKLSSSPVSSQLLWYGLCAALCMGLGPALTGCSAVDAAGDSVEAVGDGAGHAVKETGRGAGHVVSETGRAVSRSAREIEDEIED